MVFYDLPLDIKTGRACSPAPSPCRGPGRRLRLQVPRPTLPSVAAIAPATSPAVGARAAAPSARPPKYQIIGRPDDVERLLDEAGQRAQEVERGAAQAIEETAAVAAEEGEVAVAAEGVGGAFGGCGPGRGNTFRRTYSAASWGSWERKACTAASPAAPAPTRSAAACAPSAALRRRFVMEGGPCPLFVSASASKTRIADSFLSTDRRYLYWVDATLGTLNWALLPEGANTGSRLAAWISSNFATATYTASF